jgi:hypothetical protein
MTENIATGTGIVKPDDPNAKVLDLTLSDAEFAEQLEVLARDIEHLDRRARDTMFRIAARIAKAHELFLPRRDEGGFSGWVENRLGYSRAYAYRMLNVDRWAKSVSSWDTFGTLPISVIYRLAEPSVSDEVRDEIINRLKAGEKISVATVAEIIAQAKDAAEPSALPESITPSPVAEDEEESIKQRRREHVALFGEPVKIDQHDHGDAGGDHNSGDDRGNPGNGDAGGADRDGDHGDNRSEDGHGDGASDADQDDEPEESPSLLRDMWPIAEPQARRELFEAVSIDELLSALPAQLCRDLADRLIVHGTKRSAKLTKFVTTAVKSRRPADQIMALAKFKDALGNDEFEVRIRASK